MCRDAFSIADKSLLYTQMGRPTNYRIALFIADYSEECNMEAISFCCVEL